MKTLYFILILYCQASMAQSQDENLIRQVLDRQTRAWNSGSMDEYMKGYWKSDSLIFAGSSGVTYGYEQSLNNYKKNYPDPEAMGKLSFDVLQMIPLSKQFYYVIGRWHLRRQSDGPDGQFTLLFKKIKNKWVIIADHSS